MEKTTKNPDGILPKQLFKYRDWNNELHRRILTENEIYFASPKSFNDPFDGNIPFRYDKLTEEEIAPFFETYFNLSDIEQLKDEKNLQLFKHQVIKGGYYKKKEFVFQMGANLYKSLHQALGILSLTYKCDNILMWSHYSNCHSGFCVGFDFPQLIYQASQKLNGPDCFILNAVVNYQKAYPELIPELKTLNLVNIMKQLMTKSALWKYEKEFRMVLINKTNLPLKVDGNAFIKIILGLTMTLENKKQIIKLASEKFPHVKIYQAERSLDKFRLNLVKINN